LSVSQDLPDNFTKLEPQLANAFYNVSYGTNIDVLALNVLPLSLLCLKVLKL